MKIKNTCLILAVVIVPFFGCKNNSKVTIPDPDDLADSTNIVVNWDSSMYKIDSCRARFWGNQIDMESIGEYFDSQFYFELKNVEGQWKIPSSISQPSLTDCLYVSSQFRILNQSINLNKHQYQIGDKIKGSLDIMMLGKRAFFREPLIPFIDNRKWDTIRMKGHFSTRIE